jgi:hypothetical protein
LCIALLSCLCLPAIAHAETPWSVFVRSGLAGAWAMSCKSGPSETNAWMTFYEAEGGKVHRKLDRGPGTGHLNLTIDQAVLLPDGDVRTWMRNDDPAWGDQNGTVAIVVVRVADGHERSMQSASTEGEQFIKDGIFTGNGQPSPTFEKCSD